MNNLELALVLTQYVRALDKGLDILAEKIPEHKVVTKDFMNRDFDTYPILESVYQVCHDISSDIDMLRQTPDALLPVPPADPPAPPSPKGSVTFGGDGVDVTNSHLGSHDLLMYARSIIRKRAKNNVDQARLLVDLQDLIETNQAIGGREEFSRMPILQDGKEV